jgi:hypothetical protein
MQLRTIKSKTIFCLKTEDNLIFFEKGRRLPENRKGLQKKCNQKQLKVKTMVVAPLRVT